MSPAAYALLDLALRAVEAAAYVAGFVAGWFVLVHLTAPEVEE